MEKYAALLDEKPADVDLSLLEWNDQTKFIRQYFNEYGALPDRSTFEHEFGITLPTEHAPWRFYESKLKSDKFIQDALPVLTTFNETYSSDQKKALLRLREQLMGLAEPDQAIEPVSIIKDTSRYEHFKDKDNTRLPTGIEPLDNASGGLSKKDEFMIISARLGIGKSWIAHYIAKSMAVNGYKVGLYSGEMSEDEVGARFDSLVSHISNYALTRGKDIDLAQHKETLASMTGEFLVLTPRHIRHNARPSDLRKFAKSNNLDCLFIDQLSLMEPDGNQRGEDYERKARLSFQLKSLQQELQIPIVAVNQLNRGAAQQEADASNLAGSDRIGQDATLIIALSRKDDTLKMKVLKARSFRIPDEPWSFEWDIDRGILEPKLSAMDAVKAKLQVAKAKEADKKHQQQVEADDEGDDEIW